VLRGPRGDHVRPPDGRLIAEAALNNLQPEWRWRMTKRWHSRVGHRTWRAFTATAGAILSTGEICQYVWPRKRRFYPEEYKRVREAARQFADPVAAAQGRGGRRFN
jgi:hypothetical protein